MTREEYNDLTDEQRYSYILKLEEEKKVSDKALEKVLDSLKKNTTEERYILLDAIDYENSIYESSLMLRASDIVKAEKVQTPNLGVFYLKQLNFLGVFDKIYKKLFKERY